MHAALLAPLAVAALVASWTTLSLAACAGFDATGLGDEAELPSPLVHEAGHHLQPDFDLGCSHDAASDAPVTAPPPLFEVGALD